MPGPPESSLAPAVVRDAIDLARFPWIRPLVRAHAREFSTVSTLFAGDAGTPEDWRSTIARVQRSRADRVPIANVLLRQLTRRDAPKAAIDAAALLGLPTTVAIVTGQQATLFGGPLYTLLKAITTIQLAREVQRQYGVAAVPVFWVDAEDHDWDEVKTATVFDGEFNPTAVALLSPTPREAQPVGSVVLDAGTGAALDALRQALQPSEFTAALIAALERRYREGVTLGSAFAGWLDDLLGTHGLVVFEADDPAAKPLAADIFRTELSHPAQTASIVRATCTAMSALGHTPQVAPTEDAVCLFYLDEHGRRPIKRAGESYAIGAHVRSQTELITEAVAHPEHFSPNVLLRPIVQDRLFPTACYVAGPSELAYQAQLGGVYRQFGVEPPLLYSRASATLIDTAAARFLERHDVALEHLQPQDESALNRLLEHQLPPEIDQSLSEIETQLVTRTRALGVAVASVDPTLTGAVDTTAVKIRDAVKTLQNKIVQAAKRKDDTLRRQFLRTRALAFPNGTPQERAISLAFFLNRYGLTLPDRLLDHLPLTTDVHYVLAV